MPNGALKSVGSSRVYYYDTICNIKDNELPLKYMITNKPKVLNQGNVNSCVAHAIAECMQSNHMKNTDNIVDLSVLEIYGLWRGNFIGEGMFIETALDNGRTEGTLIRDVAPENLEVPEAIAKAKQYKEKYPKGFIFKVGNFFKITQNEDLEKNIKKALVQFDLPILIITSRGGMRHSEIIIGYDNHEFIVQNSYGENWGNNGLHNYSVKMVEGAYLILMDKVNLPFKDIDGHWAEKHIRNLYFAGIIDGMTKDSYCPEDYIKRGEMAKIIDIVMSKYQDKIDALEAEIEKLKKK